MKSPKIPSEVDPKSTDSNAINQIRNRNNLSKIFEEENTEHAKNMHNINSIQSGVSTKFDYYSTDEVKKNESAQESVRKNLSAHQLTPKVSTRSNKMLLTTRSLGQTSNQVELREVHNNTPFYKTVSVLNSQDNSMMQVPVSAKRRNSPKFSTHSGEDSNTGPG